MSSNLSTKRCEACEGIGSALTEHQVEQLLPQLSNEWKVLNTFTQLKRSFTFKNFYEVMNFANAIAFIANTENHHPDLELGYNYCHVTFTTHALKGLSQNDFICAAKIDKLLT